MARLKEQYQNEFVDALMKKSFGIAHNYRLGMNYAFSKKHRLDWNDIPGHGLCTYFI